jgi:hypothetical protein
MVLYECKKRGSEYVADNVVPCWLHTPKTPLLKRQERTDVVFLIPKQHLEPKTTYEVTVTLSVLAGDDSVKWRFTTGTDRTGHGALKPPKPKK